MYLSVELVPLDWINSGRQNPWIVCKVVHVQVQQSLELCMDGEANRNPDRIPRPSANQLCEYESSQQTGLHDILRNSMKILDMKGTGREPFSAKKLMSFTFPYIFLILLLCFMNSYG